jgi:hypothetical protein
MATMTKYQAIGYELFRQSENKVFTNAVIFYNNSSNEIGALFNISLELAQANALKINKRSHIDVLEIVECAKAGA